MTDFHVSLVGRNDLGGEIFRQVRQAILDGRLRPGQRLPPSRELAQMLVVSRATVTVAYERLAAEGFVMSRQGAGTFVSELVWQGAGKQPKRQSAGALQPRQMWSSVGLATAFHRPARFDFRTGLPDTSLFPHKTWRRAVAQSLRASERGGSGVYENPAGHRDLRAAIAWHVGLSRGVKAAQSDIIVTSGTQQALDVIARTLLAPGDAIAVEDPGYEPARELFTTLGLRVIRVPVDRAGLVVDALPRGVRAVYVTPSHQYPLSVTMTLPRRQALLAWAERNDAAVFEDDYDSEFRFAGRPLEPLRTLDANGRVVYIGSFSKTMLPTLRLGFLIVPPSLREAAHRAKFVSDWHTPTLAQAALARFIEEGAFARHIRRMTSIYRERHEMLADAIARYFADHLELVPSTTGLHLTALARVLTANQIAEVARRSADVDVACQPLASFSLRGTGPVGLVMGYGAIPTALIPEGMQRLRNCFALAPAD